MSADDIRELDRRISEIRDVIRELQMRVLQCEARPNAHEPLDNCPNNAAVSRHDDEIKALQRQSKARDE